MRLCASQPLTLLLVLVASALAAGARAAAYPYLILHLHFGGHLSTALAGLVIECESAITLASALVGGALIDRVGHGVLPCSQPLPTE